MPRRASRPIAALAAVLATVLGLGMALPSEAATGTTLPSHAPAHRLYDGDSGFRPPVDGFSFANYGDVAPGGGEPAALTPEALERLFPDDEVCFSRVEGRCVLTPFGEMWMGMVNDSMDGGHCEGFAVLASRFAAGLARPSDLQPGARTTAELDGRDPRVQEEIAYWFSTQYTEPTRSATVKDLTPTQALDVLRQALAGPQTPETTYRLGVRGPGGGHAITPVAVQDRGQGLWWVLVYDNNHPGLVRPLEIDTVADTWRYNLSTNPSNTEAVWTGDADTKSMLLTPLSAREGAQRCPFCHEGEGTNTLMLAGEGSQSPDNDFFVTDTVSGRRAGRIDGAIVEEIPGATVVVPASADPIATAPAPLVEVPADLNLRVTMGAPDDLEGATDLDMLMVGAFDVHLDGVELAAGEHAELELPTEASAVTFRSPNRSTPLVTVGTSPDDDPDRQYTISARARDLEAPGVAFTISSTLNDRLLFVVDGPATLDARLELDRPGEDTSVLVLEGVALDPADEDEAWVRTAPLFSWTGQDTFDADLQPDGVALQFVRPVA